MADWIEQHFGARRVTHFAFLRDGMAGDPFLWLGCFNPSPADRWQQAQKVAVRRHQRGRYRPRLKPALLMHAQLAIVTAKDRKIAGHRRSRRRVSAEQRDGTSRASRVSAFPSPPKRD